MNKKRIKVCQRVEANIIISEDAPNNVGTLELQALFSDTAITQIAAITATEPIQRTVTIDLPVLLFTQVDRSSDS